jgi:hypothetical protein
LCGGCRADRVFFSGWRPEDLGFDGIGRCSVKGFDSKVLLDPAEEELHLPALLVNIGDGFGGKGKDIGQVDGTFVFSKST